ncbi:acyl-CoA dehydrogenase family protein [Bacillus ndiopicus]|uniref:acyl-CoA dehydrogenase family protein n=1 Tax=Bacillus ndiopicus TaxID=1347368 RepID=UPI0005A85441|nr:acyl-CoA dehydrogenase family protein [Bacillus ndiopicus]
MSKQLFIKTTEQRQWLEKIATLEETFKSRSQQIDELGSFPHENIRALREIGYTKITLPKQLGGEGFTIYDAVLLHETLASFDASTALTIGWTLLTVGDLFEHGEWKPAKLQDFAREVANGAIINRAVSEFAMGSPTRGGRPTTTAKKTASGWLINGRKNYTTGAPELDYFLTSAWIEDEEKIGFFLIPRDAQGVTIDETWDVIAMRGTGSHDLVLQNVELQPSDLVEIPNNSTGFKVKGWSLLVPATYLGIAQAARDYAVHFATTHKPNSLNAPISDLPNVQTLIGEMDLALATARFTLYGAAEAYTDPARKQLVQHELNIAKYVVTNNALQIVDKAMRLVGAKSLQRNNPLQRYYRDVRAGLHNPPMDDMTIKKLAEAAIQQAKG